MLQTKKEELYKEIMSLQKHEKCAEDSNEPSDVSESDSDQGEDDLTNYEFKKILPLDWFQSVAKSGLFERTAQKT